MYNEKNMKNLDRKPVIIGTGLTGLAISYKLSKEGVDHVLLGKPPADDYHFGESLDGNGTFRFLDLFPEFLEYAYPKRYLNAHHGDVNMVWDFRIRKYFIFRRLSWFLNIEPPKYLLHLDRRNLDQALFAKCISHTQCTHVDETVTSVSHGADTLVDSITLESGKVLLPSHVFDASSHDSPMVSSLDLKPTILSREQRILSVHYTATNHSGEASFNEPPWADTTSLIQLSADVDGIDAYSWCVATGDVLSVGVTVDAELCKLSNDEILQILEDAHARRDIHIRSYFPERSQVKEVTHSYFKHDVMHGPNWVLAGPAACQVWYMSSSGVGSALTIACVAADFVRKPVLVGRRYTQFVQTLVDEHEVLNHIRYGNHLQISDAKKHRFTDNILHLNMKRVSDSGRVEGRRMVFVLGRVVYYLARGGVLFRQFCTIERQAVCTLSHDEMRDKVLKFTELFANDENLQAADQVLSKNLVIRIDNITIVGLHRWKDGVSYFRHCRGNTNLVFHCESISIDGAKVLLRGRITGSEVIESQRVRIKFRFSGDKIDRIYTTNSNDVVAFGKSFVTTWGFWTTLLKGYIWCKMSFFRQKE